MRLRIEVEKDNKLASRWADNFQAKFDDFFDLAKTKLDECFEELKPGPIAKVATQEGEVPKHKIKKEDKIEEPTNEPVKEPIEDDPDEEKSMTKREEEDEVLEEPVEEEEEDDTVKKPKKENKKTKKKITKGKYK